MGVSPLLEILLVLQVFSSDSGIVAYAIMSNRDGSKMVPSQLCLVSAPFEKAGIFGIIPAVFVNDGKGRWM